MKHIKDLLSQSAAPYRKALLKKKILLDAIATGSGVILLSKSVSLSEKGVKITASAAARSEIFSKKERIRKEFESRSGEKLPPFYQ